ncbi:MAG: PAS domain S-box protein, partial [Bacteroidales bacterium]
MQKPWSEVLLKTNTVFFQLCARGTITGITPNFHSLSGTDPSLLYRKHAFRLLNPEFLNAWKNELVGFPGGGRPMEFFTEIRFNGSPEFPILINLNDEGPEGMSGSATFLKQNHQSNSFFRQQEILRSTLQSIDDLVFVADQQGCFTECYPGNEEANLFFSSDLFVGKSFNEVGFPPEVSQKFTRAMLRARESGKTQQVQYALEVFGSQFFYQARISHRYDNHGQFEGVTAICRDIT